MAGEIDLVARMTAFALGRSVPIASHCHSAICDHALVIAPMSMAGEETTIHAVAVGHLGEPPLIRSLPDPRFRDHQYLLFRWLGEWIERYFSDQRQAGGYPQIILSSEAGAELLDALADRLRFNRLDAKVQRFGELLAYSTERYPLAGQQTLMTATGLLKKHVATGQQESDDEHLGALLTWLDPPTDVPILEAVEQAERQPMGAHTDPNFDREILEPLVRDYNKARRAAAPDSVRREKALAIRDALTPVVRAIYEATQRSIEILRGMKLPPLPDLEVLERREASEFEYFMRSRDKDFRLPLRDSPKAATHKLMARENAAENWEASLIHGDRVERARSRLDGAVISGIVEEVKSRPIAPRKIVHHILLRSKQSTLRARLRDELYWLNDPRLALTIEGVHREGRESLLELKIVAGLRVVGVPSRGDELELGPARPNYGWSYGQQKQIKKRLADPPWTHGGEQPVAETKQEPPTNLIGAVEGLR